jgi:hypothetical protein
MQTNTPYVKQFSGAGILLNPITPQASFVNASPNNRADRRGRFKYIMSYHPITGAFIGKTKAHGNNRKPNRKGQRTAKF